MRLIPNLVRRDLNDLFNNSLAPLYRESICCYLTMKIVGDTVVVIADPQVREIIKQLAREDGEVWVDQGEVAGVFNKYALERAIKLGLVEAHEDGPHGISTCYRLKRSGYVAGGLQAPPTILDRFLAAIRRAFGATGIAG